MRRLAILFALGFISLWTVSAQEGHNPQMKDAAKSEESAQREREDPNELTWKWVNFALLAGGLGYLIGKHGGPFFRNRTDEIQRGIKEASALKAEADAKVADMERRLANIQEDIQRFRTQASREMEAEGQRIRQESTDQIAKVQARSEQEIATAAKSATGELKAYSAGLALDLAEKQIRNRVHSELQNHLVDAFVTDLRKRENHGKAGLN